MFAEKFTAGDSVCRKRESADVESILIRFVDTPEVFESCTSRNVKVNNLSFGSYFDFCLDPVVTCAFQYATIAGSPSPVPYKSSTSAHIFISKSAGSRTNS